MLSNQSTVLISETLRALLMGQNQVAQHKLMQVTTKPNKGAPDTGKAPLQLRWEVFTRDHFVCRYCDRHTIFMPILVGLSFKFPEDFPYAGENNNAQCHGSFWTDIPVVDLLYGETLSAENAVTACFSCKTAKQRFPDPNRWRPKAISDISWDGLSGKLNDLCVVTKTAALPYFFEWLKIIRE